MATPGTGTPSTTPSRCPEPRTLAHQDDSSDGNNLDSDQPLYFGRPTRCTAGLTNGSDLVTVSYDILHDHGLRVRYGQADVYNNW